MLYPFTRLLPFRTIDQVDILQMYSLDGTGVGGKVVIFETGNQDPLQSAGQFSSTNPGFTPQGVTNPRYELKRKVTSAVGNAVKHQVAGITLNGTIEVDENGQKIIFNP